MNENVNNGSITVEWTGTETTAEKQTKIQQAFTQAIALTPNFTELPSYDIVAAGTHFTALVFDGMTVDGSKTKIFAYIAFPDGASAENKVPAMVLAHGGGGHAFFQWVKKWTDKGYAAISFSTNGYFPTATGIGVTWQYGMPVYFQEEGYVNAPNCDSMKKPNIKVDKQWIYNGVGQAILAANVIRSYASVDSTWVGIQGISWGAVISTIGIGYDTRFSCSINIYGAGFLDQNLAAVVGPSYPASLPLWLAQDKFDNAEMPQLWLCGNSDANFSVNVNDLSYKDTKASNALSTLSIVPNFLHSHTDGWSRPESFVFADGVVNSSSILSQFTTQPSGRTISCTFTKDADTTNVSAKVKYITEYLSYTNHKTIDQVWQEVALTVTGNTITGTVPETAKEYYIELSGTIDGSVCYSSSEIVIL